MAGVVLTRRGRVGILTIQNEPRANALSREVLAAFRALRDVIARDGELRALIVTGSGDRAFSAGADLKERAAMTESEVREQVGSYQDTLGWLEVAPLPVVAAINGAALGGGLELALMCDLRIAAPHAALGLPETSLGIIPAAGGTQRLPRLVGVARAKQMILLGERWTAQHALAMGLVNRLSSTREGLLDETVEWLAPLERGAPIAQAAALRAIDEGSQLSLADGLRLEQREYERCLTTEDRNEALRAFLEKRAPSFSGR